jgi:peptidyl-prolyl cis-trans isomerase A (cyclophilin A)
MVQGGCPQELELEILDINLMMNFTQVLNMMSGISMANLRSWIKRFSILYYTPYSWLDGKHTVFGHVVEGQDVVDAIAQGDLLKVLKL